MELTVVVNCAKVNDVSNCVFVSWSGNVMDGDTINLNSKGNKVDTKRLVAQDKYWQTAYQMDWTTVTEKHIDLLHVDILREGKDGLVTIGMGWLRLKTDWQFEMKDKIGNLPFRDLVIPGVHNAAARAGFGFLERNLSNCQAVPIVQLGLLGARFYDIRIRLDEKGNFLIVHGKIDVCLLDSFLQEMMRLTVISPDVFFIDLHEASVGFESFQDYEKLFHMFEEIIGDQLGIPNEIENLNAAFGKNKRIIISLSDHRMFDTPLRVPNWCYGPIHHVWANEVDFLNIPAYMLKYLKYYRNSKDVKVLCLQSTKGVFAGYFTSLAEFAWVNSGSITSFVDSISGYKPNVIIADHIESTCLVQQAIQMNSLRKEAPNSNPDHSNCTIM